MVQLRRRLSTAVVSRTAGVLAAAILACLQAVWLATSPAGAAGGSWPVYHHDAARTGVAAAGPSLSTPIQRWATPDLDGAIYAEPVVSGSIVIVVTENDTVYGLDAGNGRVAWSRHLATPAPLSLIHSLGVGCGNINPLGITSTPVIDQSRGEVFVAAEVDTGNNVAHRLFGLSVTNGQPMLAATSVDPPGLPPVAEQQRAALALGSGRVYVSYGGLAGDCGPYRGAVESVTEDGGSPVSFIVPTTREGGIWGPSGPAISSTGDVYVSVGNGAQTDPTKPFDGSDSVTQLDSTLHVKSRFAPSGWASDNAADLDLGSTGPELLQNGQLFQVGKRGDAYLLKASNLGGVGGQLGESHVCTSFGGQAYAAPTIYVSCTDGVRAVQVNAQNNGFNPIWHGPSAATGPPILGGGLVWVVGNDQRLYGLDPSTGMSVPAPLPIPASQHFVTPTVADGEVLVGTGRTVEAYDEGPAARPGAPAIGQATAGDAQATVAFTPPAADGGLPIMSYTATARDLTNPAHGGQTAASGASPITVTGLTNGDSYTLSVTATNAKGAGPPSGPSNAVTPSASTAPPVVSSPQFGVPNQTDVFRVAGNGAVEVFWIDGSGAFHGPLAVSGPGLAPEGAHLAVSQQFGIANQTDVFVVANNGATQVLWVAGGGRWNGPLAVSAAGLAPPGAGLGASAQVGVPNQTDVFVVADDGSARVLWVAGGGRWNGPLAVSAGGLAPPGAHLAVSPQFGVPNQTDVFVVADDGSARVLWVQGAGRWNGPLAVAPTGMAPAGADLAVSAQLGVPNQTDVFAVANDGAAEVLWVQGAGRWNGPLAVARAGLSPPGAHLAVSPQFGVANQTDVFVVADDGSARVLWVQGAGRWNGPLAISPTGRAEAGGHLAASQQFGDANRTDVFVVTSDGATKVLWVQGGGSWNGPLAI
jgi:outer membrane protein assembly factor BamB